MGSVSDEYADDCFLQSHAIRFTQRKTTSVRLHRSFVRSSRTCSSCALVVLFSPNHVGASMFLWSKRKAVIYLVVPRLPARDVGDA